MFKVKRETSDGKLALILLLPSTLLILLLIGYPMLSNFYISFFEQPINPEFPAEFVGFENYIETLTNIDFYKSLGITLLYTLLVVVGSTALGLYVAIMFNRPFRFRKVARSLIILSYVTPSISLIFVWKYMFNSGYGIINYIGRDILHLFDRAPLWFDNPTSAFILVVLFAIWRYFPYAFIAFLAILQTISPTLYEAAEMDGANIWQKFKAVTLPAIMPVMLTVITLRTIWMFYMFEDVYLLTNKVNVLGVYLYETAFAFNDLGKASAISVILFLVISTLIIAIRKKVNLNASS
ncbi:carbohydrate ABC transporter permease [Halobacillus naozhouensis]|uniref:Sugar ABC transporter permease n=1 Tax=Halobacillus naozhouensis TaxID=554880 RepID=A0ABY8IZB8_9BACI|nr:sugar ABC transporter permease [Halobacillus naozhouensis]WFT75583.1 sugar ABC transporter permease [Halobacillus naozhouensis]